jgi:hypothetical protein
VAVSEIVPDLDVDHFADIILTVLAPRHVGHQRRELAYDLDRIIGGVRRLFVERLRAQGAPSAHQGRP